jgi:hypothetical protein
MGHELTNQEKVACTRDLNLREGLPDETPDKDLCNGAQFEAPQIDHRLFLVAKQRFVRPIVPRWLKGCSSGNALMTSLKPTVLVFA